MLTLQAHAADRWTRCAMSAHLTSSDVAIPNEETEDAATGTAAMWVVETIINGDATCVEDMVGKIHRNGVEIDADIARLVDPLVKRLQTRSSAHCENSREYGNDAVRIVGRSDAESWSSPTDFHIDDLKFGFRIVEPTTQELATYALLAYAAGIRAERWHLSIFQPRAVHHLGEYRTISLNLQQIESMVAILWSRAITVAGTGEGVPGNWCRNCRVGAVCDALTESVYSMWGPLESRTYTVPTAQQLSDELDMLDRMSAMMNARIEAVKAETQVRLKNGEVIPNYAMMPQTGQRRFKYAAGVIQAMTGVDPRNVTLCTPAELERRGVPTEIVGLLSDRPTVGYKLGKYDPDKIGNMFKAKS